MEAVIKSPLGNLKLVEQENRLIEINFTTGELVAVPNNQLLQSTSAQLGEYFEGKRKKFELDLNPTGTSFQHKVWQELKNIPYGVTISYQELANRLGDPKCIRAAGRANGKNPIAIVIPCHRVIGAHGEMTGYAGGIDKKRGLLKLEGASVMNQMDIF